MKKIIAIAFVGMFGVLTLGSCKKDYVCECTTSGSTTPTKIDIKDSKKKDAKEACDKLNYAGITSCSLK